MLSHGALSSGRIWLAIVVPSLASRGISWHSALTSRLFASRRFSVPLLSCLSSWKIRFISVSVSESCLFCSQTYPNSRIMQQLPSLPYPLPHPLLLSTVIIIIIICTKSFRQLPISLSRFVPGQQWREREHFKALCYIYSV